MDEPRSFAMPIADINEDLAMITSIPSIKFSKGTHPLIEIRGIPIQLSELCVNPQNSRDRSVPKGGSAFTSWA
jgi:hypothetical protein